MRRYLWVFAVLALATGPLVGCGERVSQPLNEQGLPVDPPEPEAPPADGTRARGRKTRAALAPRVETAAPIGLAAGAGVEAARPGRA